MDLKLGHYGKDGIEVVDIEGEIDIYTAPRLRELLIDLAGKTSYQLVVNLDKVGFLDSTGLGVLVGGLRPVRVHDGSLDLVCTQDPILRIFRVTGLMEVFGIYQTVGPGHHGQEGAPVRNVSPGEVAEGSGAIGLGRSHSGLQRNGPGPGGARRPSPPPPRPARCRRPWPGGVIHRDRGALVRSSALQWPGCSVLE